MKTLISILLCLFLGNAIEGQNQPPALLAETDRYEFYGHFWLNMHHYLQQEALIRKVKDSTIIDWEKFSQRQKEITQEVLTYYKLHLVDKDLRTDDYQEAFRQWVITQNDGSIAVDRIPDSMRVHCEMLQRFAPVYRKYFWPEHFESIQKVLNDNLELVDQSEEGVSERLSYLTRSFWQEEKIRVDICYYAKSTEWNLKNRPYTDLGPTHTVMHATQRANTPKGNWLELLYHESSHHLIGSVSGFVGGTIGDVAGFPDTKPPRQLWHAYLFYFSGVVTREFLEKNGMENYELYMVREKVFSRYFPYLDKYLPPYMRFEESLHDATKKIIEDIKSNRD